MRRSPRFHSEGVRAAGPYAAGGDLTAFAGSRPGASCSPATERVGRRHRARAGPARWATAAFWADQLPPPALGREGDNLTSGTS